MPQVIDTILFPEGWTNLLAILKELYSYNFDFTYATVDFRNRTDNSVIIKSSLIEPQFDDESGIHLVNGQAWSGRINMRYVWVKTTADTEIDFSAFNHV